MQGIKELLEGYRKRLLRTDEERKQIANMINEISMTRLNEHDIVMKQGVITLHTDAVTKNQVFLYKTKILAAINDLNLRKISDIN